MLKALLHIHQQFPQEVDSGLVPHCAGLETGEDPGGFSRIENCLLKAGSWFHYQEAVGRAVQLRWGFEWVCMKEEVASLPR